MELLAAPSGVTIDAASSSGGSTMAGRASGWTSSSTLGSAYSTISTEDGSTTTIAPSPSSILNRTLTPWWLSWTTTPLVQQTPPGLVTSTFDPLVNVAASRRSRAERRIALSDSSSESDSSAASVSGLGVSTFSRAFAAACSRAYASRIAAVAGSSACAAAGVAGGRSVGAGAVMTRRNASLSESFECSFVSQCTTTSSAPTSTTVPRCVP
mmetsp:Transcript_5043/g.12626  ORF Transcript_5043/g.12626 Transcript_5043/m.12626 type:complete len:211 (-) Transcript_5043:314-946(-)